jgi:hypothetical protein
MVFAWWAAQIHRWSATAVCLGTTTGTSQKINLKKNIDLKKKLQKKNLQMSLYQV